MDPDTNCLHICLLKLFLLMPVDLTLFMYANI